MRTLDRYIFREVAVTCIAVTVVLLVILLSNQLARVLSQAAANDFPRQVVFALIALTSAGYLTVIVPIGFFLSIMLGARPPVPRERDGGDPVVRRRPRGAVPADRPARLAASPRCWSGCRSGRSRRRPHARSRSASKRCAMRSSARSSRGGSAPSPAATIVFYAERVDDNRILHNVNVFVDRTRGAGQRGQDGGLGRNPRRAARRGTGRADVHALRRAPLRGRARAAASSASSSSPRAASRSGSASWAGAASKAELKPTSELLRSSDPADRGRAAMAHLHAAARADPDGARCAARAPASAAGPFRTHRRCDPRVLPLLAAAGRGAHLGRKRRGAASSSASGGCTQSRCASGCGCWCATVRPASRVSVAVPA